MSFFTLPPTGRAARKAAAAAKAKAKEDAALAEKLDSLKDVQETGRIAKLQQSSCFVTDPKLRKKGTAASVAARASEVKERGAWIP